MENNKINTVKPSYNKPYFCFFKNESGETCWTRIRVCAKKTIILEEIRHKKSVYSVLQRPHTKFNLLHKGVNFILLIPEKDTKGVPRHLRGRFYQN